MRSEWRVLALALVAVAGCAGRDTVAVLAAGGAVPVAPAPSLSPTPDPIVIGTAHPAPSPTPTPSSYCGGTSPPVLLDGTCTGVLSQRVFGRAACACGALSLGADLITDGFDSRVAAWTAGGAGGDVGALGGLAFPGLLQVGGNLAVSGGGVQAGSTLRVAGDLEAGGDLGLSHSAVEIGGSARIGGNVGVASLSVGGTLTTPPGATVTGAISGTAVTGAVTVAPACPCDAAQAVDVAGIVAQHQVTNDNASIGLAPGALADVWAPTTLALPCGRFYLDRIQGGVSITLRATGRAALFVGSGITVAGPLAIELDPGAELDLFVAGPVNLPASLRIGDPARPSALRLWLATGGSIGVPYGAQWAANLYAPAADLSASTPVDLFGAVLVAHLLNGAPVSIHYDRAISAAAVACAP